MSGRLIICPTPIGNLGDITLRTLEALKACDVVYAEDTRVTGKLLAHFSLEKSMVRLDEASMEAKLSSVADRICAGEIVAYCTDAGMPGVSDPGQRLIAAISQQGLPVDVLPGASAASLAYVAAHFPAMSYYFGGFFPRKYAAQKQCLATLAYLDAALIFYESPHRLVASLKTICEVFPLREVAVCRELTKLHEEVLKASTYDAYITFKKRSEAGDIRGEIALVIGPAVHDEHMQRKQHACQCAQDKAYELSQTQTYDTKSLVKFLRSEYGISRNEAYDIALSVQG